MRPWLGAELAYAAVSPTDSLVLAAVADRPKAQALVARIRNLSRVERYRGVRLLVAGSTAVAFVGDFLAFGTEAAVRAAVDCDQGASERLAALPAYRRASDDMPEGRSLDAYASAAGVREVIAPRDGLLGALGALLERPGLTAVGASLTAEEQGLRAHVRLAGGAPRDTGFEPLLIERVPESAAAYAGVRGALRLARVLKRLGVERPVKQLRAAVAGGPGIGLKRDLLEPLTGELAIAVNGPRTIRGDRRSSAGRDAHGPHGGPAAGRGGPGPAAGAARAAARPPGHGAGLGAGGDRRAGRLHAAPDAPAGAVLRGR